MKNKNRFLASKRPVVTPAGWQMLLILIVLTAFACLPLGAAHAAATPGSPMFLAKPADVTTTAVSTSQLNLTWVDISSYETGYSIERQLEGERFVPIAVMPANTQAYSDSGLTPGTFYTYRLKAVGNGSTIYDSAFSAEVSARTHYEVIVIPVTPGTPTGLTAAAVSSSQISLTWNDQSANETGYRIERKTGAADFVQVSIIAPDSKAFTDSGLMPATTYTYRVQAVGNQGDVRDSGYSNQASAMTGGTIEAPVWLETPASLTAIPAGTSRITLAWVDKSDHEYGYSIERQAGGEEFGPLDSVLANITFCVDDGLASGTTYNYRVRAYGNGRDVHNSAYSNEASATTNVAPTGQKVMRYYLGKSQYSVNGQAQLMDTTPMILQGRTMLPVTYVAPALGAIVYWSQAEQKVTITLDSTTIEMWINLNIARVNGSPVMIDPGNSEVMPTLVPPGRTMLPLRFIAEQLNSQVDWDADQQMVTVTYPKR